MKKPVKVVVQNCPDCLSNRVKPLTNKEMICEDCGCTFLKEDK